MTIIGWVLAFVVAFPVLLYSQYQIYKTHNGVDYYSCRESYPTLNSEIAFNIFLLIALFGLPGIFMTLAYLKITMTLYKGMRGKSRDVKTISLKR